MLAGVSHDLKTPLTRMRLQSESIKDEKIKDWNRQKNRLSKLK